MIARHGAWGLTNGQWVPLVPVVAGGKEARWADHVDASGLELLVGRSSFRWMWCSGWRRGGSLQEVAPVGGPVGQSEDAHDDEMGRRCPAFHRRVVVDDVGGDRAGEYEHEGRGAQEALFAGWGSRAGRRRHLPGRRPRSASRTGNPISCLPASTWSRRPARTQGPGASTDRSLGVSTYIGPFRGWTGPGLRAAIALPTESFLSGFSPAGWRWPSRYAAGASRASSRSRWRACARACSCTQDCRRPRGIRIPPRRRRRPVPLPPIRREPAAGIPCPGRTNQPDDVRDCAFLESV